MPVYGFCINSQIKRIIMNSKTRKILRAISIIIVLVAVFIQLDVINITVTEITDNIIWLMIIAYGLLLVTSKG
jgi:hypothetical protein